LCGYVSSLLYLLWHTVNGAEEAWGKYDERIAKGKIVSNLFAHRRLFVRCITNILGTAIGEIHTISAAQPALHILRTRHPLTCFGRAVLCSFSKHPLRGQRYRAEKVCGSTYPPGREDLARLVDVGAACWMILWID
jgi:hypothetical protein